jgi:hypothetical protein
MKPWRGAALGRALRPSEIHPSAHAISSLIKQAAPANDPERCSSIGYARINDRVRGRHWEKHYAG